MDLKYLFNSYLVYGIDVRSNGLNGKDAWGKKISQQDNSQNKISGGWITTRTFYDGTKSSDPLIIYDYLYMKLGMKGELSDRSNSSNNNFEQFHFLLQTARLVKNNPICTIERLVQVAYNVGQMLASIDFYCTYPSILQYISVNKLNHVESYINLSSNGQSGGTAPIINYYKKYIDMTPYKGSTLFGGSCKCGESECIKCDGSTFINLLI